MEPLRVTNLDVAQVDFKPQEVPSKSAHADKISINDIQEALKGAALYANVKNTSLAH